jgi:uncharacterized protein YkwD
MNPIARRTVLAGGLLLGATPSLAASPQPWIAYERRLRGLLSDPPEGDFDEDFEQTLLDLNNVFRGRQGPVPLTWDRGLSLAARAHAADMAVTGEFEHITREGYSPAGRVGLLARDLVGAPGENIAMRRNASGAVQPNQIMDQWRTSPGHRANLLAPGFTHVGYGVLRQGPRVIAVGAYAEVAARLAGPSPAEGQVVRRDRPRPLGRRPVNPPVLGLRARRRGADHDLCRGPPAVGAGPRRLAAAPTPVVRRAPLPGGLGAGVRAGLGPTEPPPGFRCGC